MGNLIKYLTGHTYRPLLAKYLSVTRPYSYKGIRLLVPPEVFHPGFFFSTRLLLGLLSRQPLNGRTLLELGAGSGLISFFTAREGAIVTSSDINPVAVKFLKINRSRNELYVNVIESDLFNGIPPQTFDIIAINPPYYCKEPVSDAQYAWYCGEQGEYFSALFYSLKTYTHRHTATWMILNDGCNLPLIHNLARENGWKLDCIWSRKNWLERNFIFAIHPLKRQS